MACEPFLVEQIFFSLFVLPKVFLLVVELPLQLLFLSLEFSQFPLTVVQFVPVLVPVPPPSPSHVPLPLPLPLPWLPPLPLRASGAFASCACVSACACAFASASAFAFAAASACAFLRAAVFSRLCLFNLAEADSFFDCFSLDRALDSLNLRSLSSCSRLKSSSIFFLNSSSFLNFSLMSAVESFICCRGDDVLTPHCCANFINCSSFKLYASKIPLFINSFLILSILEGPSIRIPSSIVSGSSGFMFCSLLLFLIISIPADFCSDSSIAFAGASASLIFSSY
jgi:hypothetical protein